MITMDQNIASLAALEVASQILYDNTPLHMDNVLESDGDLVAIPYKIEDKIAENLSREEKRPTGRSARRRGKVAPSLPIAMRKPKGYLENNANIAMSIARTSDKKGVPVVDSSGNKMVSVGVVVNTARPQSVHSARKRLRDTNRKNRKFRQNIANSSEVITSSVRSTMPTKNVVKSSLGRLNRNSGLKSLGFEGRIPDDSSTTGVIGDKAENNNWMLDTEEQSNTQGGLVVTKSFAPCFIEQNSDTKEALKSPPVDNSCGVASLSRQGSNVPGDTNPKSYSPDGRLMTRPAESPDSKKVSCNAGLCVACGNDVQIPKCALCKHCRLRHLPDDDHTGPLDELKAYAQSFANSVKKILLSSPVLELSSETLLHGSTADVKSEESATCTTREEAVPRKPGPEVCLNRYMTEINLGRSAEVRSKSLLSKSMSYDGRVGSCMDEKGMRSNWINHNRIKASGSFSKMTDYRQSRVEGDCLNNEKEEISFLALEGEKNRINKAEKLKTKVSTKQLARVERARTDGDLRSNNAQTTMSKKQVKEEPKKGFEFQRNRSKTFHELDTGFEDEDSCSPEREAETDIIISRLKVIHEGSPVDPPNTADSRKGEDSKGRKAAFIRSATAPYKNHLPRKDVPTSLTMLDNSVKLNRSNTKITVRTNKASTLRKENSLSDRRKMQDMLEAYADDDSVVNSMSFTKRRSTSFDSSHVGPKRDELHRSSSWSVIDGDEEESKHRRETPPSGFESVKRLNELNEKRGFSFRVELPTRFRVNAHEFQSTDNMPVDPFLYSEMSVDTTFKQKRLEANSSELSPIKSLQERSRDNGDHLQLIQSQTEYAFDIERMYYDDVAEKQLSPYVEDDEHIEGGYDRALDSATYYTHSPKIAHHQVEDNLTQADQYKDDSALKSDEDENIYHEGITKYASPDVSNGKNSPWYSPLQVLSSDERSFMRRDRSMESKSTTSFHIVTLAKSSHSDEAITKYGGVLEHAFLRRQSPYTETDVDTGLIYHLAKRQTTRAQVPNYQDLTRGSREIYTMSGDVSTSTSSNSANSNKTELSESVYTGGFYNKDDPFYDNGSRSSSSEESASDIYFESTGISKRELSEIDIYTGSIFNSNQNMLAHLAHVTGTESTNQENDVKDSRIMTSSRSSIGRMQRSVRCRPRVETMFKNNDTTWGYFSQPVMICGEAKSYNVSNNSNNWHGMNEYDNSCQNCTIITKSADPMYTDYDPGMRPEFNVRHIEKSGAVFNFLKYDSAEEASKTFFTPPRRDDPCNDGIWYSGLLHDQSVGDVEAVVSRSQHSLERSPYSWQHHDDYYTSTVRPIVNKTNNCSSCTRDSIPCDSNNNHFDDIYTGSYGAQNVPPAPQEPAPPARPPVAENWYVKQPTPTYTSSTLHDQAFESCYTVPGPARRSASELYEPLRDSYSSYASQASSKAFRPEPQAASESSVYMVDDSWWKYGPKVSSQQDEPPRPRKPEKTPSGEPESYFNYASKGSPDQHFYVIDDDTYSFDSKVESEIPDAPVVKEIKTVGGIVCRENVANKDDYAEDINRDLEPGAWVPFTFRRDEDAKYSQETSGGHDKTESQRTSEAGHGMKHMDDTYANNRLYDNFGARKSWQRPQGKQENNASRSRDSSQHRSFQSGDSGRQDQSKNRVASDIIPDKARGKRSMSNTPKAFATENSSGANKGSASSNKNKRPATKEESFKRKQKIGYPLVTSMSSTHCLNSHLQFRSNLREPYVEEDQHKL